MKRNFNHLLETREWMQAHLDSSCEVSLVANAGDQVQFFILSAECFLLAIIAMTAEKLVCKNYLL
jgi:hypothetical protein